jgi:single-strand DNA-binding protein
VVWRGLADIAEKFLKKGMTIYLEGKLRSRSWDDKEGNKRYTTEIVADTFTMLGKKENNPSGGNNGGNNLPNELTKSEDDLPF